MFSFIEYVVAISYEEILYGAVVYWLTGMMFYAFYSVAVSRVNKPNFLEITSDYRQKTCVFGCGMNFLSITSSGR